MYIIFNHKSLAKGVNINGAKLMFIDASLSEVRSAKRTEEILVFQKATPKGWRSSAPILVDFDYTVANEPFACEVLVISDEVARALVAAYGDVKVKVYVSPEDRASIKAADAMCRLAEMTNADGGWCGGDSSASTWVRPEYK